jgi:hypothetical protein
MLIDRANLQSPITNNQQKTPLSKLLKDGVNRGATLVGANKPPLCRRRHPFDKLRVSEGASRITAD